MTDKLASLVQPPAAGAGPQGPLAGRTVLVTGGARGLGAEIGKALGAAGARIAVADLMLDGAEAAAAALRDTGVEARAFAVDVGHEMAVQKLVAEVAEVCGSLDAVINNAAVDVTAPIGELQAVDWDRIVRTNLSGPFFVAKHAAQRMLAQGGAGGVRGHIVNIASTASKRAWPNASAYHATKWGLLGLSHALHAELRPQGIKVCAVVAGGMRTPFLLDRFPDIDPGVLQDPAHVARSVLFVLTQPEETVIPELMVLPMRETSWP
ncbi:MAG TPA: SDR family oxidoreductase [Methylibium sp.]|uniref:SDR family oxidoreductase n=1 Tax=Methylibium sp. TaxID=2067992 RepID=UPI002DBE29BE|nr:SDR family oxidoreductase [Methylibium sp.]HEU4459126.1 SDR family oxidoreductase [Methylibium sp.]